MNRNEANQVSEKLKGLFPKMTDTQMLAVAEKIEKFPVTAVDRAITKLADTSEDFSLPRLLFLIRAEQIESTTPAQYPTHLAVLRKDASRKFPAKAEKIAAMPDAEFAMRIGRGWWMGCSAPIDGSPDGQRASAWKHRGVVIVREVCQLLENYCSIEAEDAKRCALACVDDEAGYQAMLASAMREPEIPVA